MLYKSNNMVVHIGQERGNQEGTIFGRDYLVTLYMNGAMKSLVLRTIWTMNDIQGVKEFSSSPYMYEPYTSEQVEKRNDTPICVVEVFRFCEVLELLGYCDKQLKFIILSHIYRSLNKKQEEIEEGVDWRRLNTLS